MSIISYDLSQGPNILKFQTFEQTLFLDRLENGQPSKCKGVGTESYKKIMEVFFKQRLTSVTTDASYSSHVFHTFMGMVPEERFINSVRQNFGTNGNKALTQILQTSSSQPEVIDRILEKKGLLLKEILLFYTDPSAPEPADSLSREEFEAHRETFQKISEKTESYIQTEFLPEIIQKRLPKAPDGQRAATYNMGSVTMKMSDAGIHRWQECIENNTSFKPFKDLSHLSDYMTQEQRLSCMG